MKTDQVQRWRRLLQAGFFILFVTAPIFDLFRLDLTLGHFIIVGQPWTLGLDDFVAHRITSGEAALRLVLRGFLPIVAIVGTVIFISWKWGRLYCGWLCPHFSVVETINQLLRRAIGRQSLWERQAQPAQNPDGSITPQNPLWWLVVVPLVIGFAFLWALVALTYLLPPFEIYSNLWQLKLTRNQALFLGVGTALLSIEFLFARHLFCRYACAAGLFQSLAWMANRRAMVVSFQRERAVDCASCHSACDHACPMRLKPRKVKRMMFACVQCVQCLNACEHTQKNNPKGPLLSWQQGAAATHEASFDGKAARKFIPLKQVD